MHSFDPTHFLDRVFAALRHDGIDVAAYELDHICYRVETQARFNELRTWFAQHGALLGEHIISGRPIATYRLRVPIHSNGRNIAVVELPAPKEGSPYAEGFEHAEFVVDDSPSTFAAGHPLLTWDLSGANKPVNADVRLCYDGFSVKFHRQSLADVIKTENGS